MSDRSSRRFSVALSAVLAAAAWLAGASPAAAHQPPPPPPPSAKLEISATPASVTLATASLPTYASYTVTITSLERYKSLQVQEFDASSAVIGATGSAVFNSASGASCSASNGAQTAIRCLNVGTLAPLASLSFTVTFKAPTAGTSIKLVGTSKTAPVYSSYSHTGYSWSPPPCDEQTASATTALTAPDPLKVETYLPAPTGGTVFTGLNSGVATKKDPWTTTVVVPRSSTVSINETADPTVPPTVCPFNYVCAGNFSKLAIPGEFDNLVITLRRDSTTISSNDHDCDDHDGRDRDARYSPNGYSRPKKGGIKDAKVFYKADPKPGDPDPQYVEVLACSITGGPVAGTPTAAGRPCIQSRTAYTRYNAPTPEWVGDWEFVILAKDNGSYRN